ncbi:cilia- and flagella-associated protein 251-like [Polistes fuscatus]|uniref:cilia- and flagella-associated protein 251-like n=1 Tax=Polistes fuscatus TaxID=30207 RepID=UPI001CA899B3|nr:cilia- and flagella-associated protein 251-like [Polistes fuscatus]
MLAAFIRCAFLIGILGWYSINVWKMIDGYFRDQFASYLHEEYRKNPRMKSDVKDVKGTDKKENHVIDGNVLIEKLEELKRRESSSVDKVDPEENVESWESVEISKLIDRPNESVEGKEILEIIVTEKEDSNNNDELVSMTKKGPDNEMEEEILEKPKKKKLVSKKEEEEEMKEEKEKSKKGRKKKKKKRVKTITLKEEDFMSVKKRQRGTIGQDEDFWEFEEDKEEGEREREEEMKGIRVADLPFKPKLDIGRLERITPDEYCPLTLEDELSCEETTEWSLK